MELRTLQYFLTIAREENITKAAKVLHITQPTLSRQMSQLEDEVGAKLFERGKQFKLTEEGYLLRRRAQEIVELMDKMQMELDQHHEISGIISIGMGGLQSSSFVLNAMKQFKLLYPQVQFEIISDNADEVIAKLDHGVLDFGVVMEPSGLDSFEYVKLPGKEVVGVAITSTHPIASKQSITREDLKEIPLILPSRKHIQSSIARWLKDTSDYNIFGYGNLITSNQVELLAENEIGALIVQGALYQPEEHHISFLPLEPEVSFECVLAWKRGAKLNNATTEFLSYIQSMLETYNEV